MAKLKLDHSVIEGVCQGLRFRMKWHQIAAKLSIHPGTLRGWIVDGEKAKSGIKRELFLAVERTKSELYEDYSEVVRNAILHGHETTTTKIRKDAAGNTYTEEVTKRTGPNAGLALKVLALMQPEQWASVQRIKIDWREPVKDLGLNPLQIEAAFFKYLDNNQDKIGSIPIPKVTDKTV